MLPEKLRNRSAHELWVRGRQHLWVIAERMGFRGVQPRSWRPGLGGSAGVPTCDGLLPSECAEHVLARWPEHVAETERVAGEVEAGRFDLLGHRGVSFGTPIDWHLDPLRGRRSPRCHWSRVPFLDASIVGDHKLIWELNRQQYLVTLARAFWLTGDRAYAQLARDHMHAWVEDNPPGIGINWASSLEVAFRAISWIWTYRLLEPSGFWTDRDTRMIEQVLFLHGRHVERNLSTYFSPNTHLTGEALGLLYLGSTLNGRGAVRWRRVGLRILDEALHRQVRSDGSYFENSTWYHRYTLDFYLHASMLIRAAGGEPPAPWISKLLQMAEHLAWLTLPDGTTPLIGDDDGGRLLPLDSRPSADFRDTLALAATVLGKGHLKAVAGPPGPALCWSLGARGMDTYAGLPATHAAPLSRAFADGPTFVMRDGWGADASALVLEGGVASAGSVAHGHASALSVTIAAGGWTCIVDPGTYSYVPPDRDLFRRTAAHSTVVVGGRSVPMPRGMFSWEDRPAVTLDRWIGGRRLDYAAVTHHSSPAHHRDILFLRGECWLMIDSIDGPEALPCELRFQAAPGATLETGPGRAKLSLGDRNLLLSFAAEDAPAQSSGVVSTCYGRLEEAPVVSVRFAGGQSVLTAIVPMCDDEHTPEIRCSRSEAVVEYWIKRGRRTYYVARSLTPEGLRTDLVAADCEIVVLGWESPAGPIDVFAPVKAVQVVVDGQPQKVSTTSPFLDGSLDRGRFTEAS